MQQTKDRMWWPGSLWQLPAAFAAERAELRYEINDWEVFEEIVPMRWRRKVGRLARKLVERCRCLLE